MTKNALAFSTRHERDAMRLEDRDGVAHGGRSSRFDAGSGRSVARHTGGRCPVFVPMRDEQVLITGASRGIGLAMAIDLAKLGAAVLMVSRDPERASEAQRAVARVATGAPPRVLLADVSPTASRGRSRRTTSVRSSSRRCSSISSAPRPPGGSSS